MESPAYRIELLVCHEESASAAYRHALNRASQKNRYELEVIQHRHEEAAQLLKAISKDHGNPNAEDDTWIGVKSPSRHTEKDALQSLYECESLAIAKYEYCLRDNGIPLKSRAIIVNRLIPNTLDHIRNLQNLLQSVNTSVKV